MKNKYFNFGKLTKDEQIDVYRQSFNLFVADNYVENKRQYYYLDQYRVANSELNKYRNIYYESYASPAEKERYEQKLIELEALKQNKINEDKKKEIKYLALYKELLQFESIEQAVQYLIDNKVKLQSLRTYINNIDSDTGDKNSDISRLLLIFRAYGSYLKGRHNVENEDNKKQHLTCAIIKAQAFIDSDATDIEQFCNDNGISANYFRTCLYFVIKDYEIELYNKFINKLKTIEEEKKAKTIKVIDEMLNLIKHSNELYNRPFDLLDYHLLTNLSFDEILTECKKGYLFEDYRLIKSFIMVNKNNATILTKTILEGTQIVTNNGVRRMVTMAEKKNIIEYLSRNNIPLNNTTYELAFKHYLNKQLVERQGDISTTQKIIK